MRDDERVVARHLAAEVAADQLRPRLRQLRVAADVIEMCVRVDDVANRLAGRELSDFCQQRVGVLLAHRVDDDETLFADLHDSVTDRSGDEIHLAVHLEHIHRRRRRLRALRMRGRRRDEHAHRHRNDLFSVHQSPRGTTARVSY